MQAQRIKSIKSIGIQNTLDLEVDHPDHNFYAEGIVTSNSHSLGVSYLGALTVYLKYKYPIQWYMACLKNAHHSAKPLDEIAMIQREFEWFQMKLLPPDLLKSDLDFKIEDNNIRFGLSMVKNVAEKSFEKLIKFRKPYSNKFEMFQASKQAGLSSGILSSLIMAGCLEPMFNESRLKLVLEAQLWNILTDKEKTLALQYAEQFKYDLIAIIQHLKITKNEKNKELIKPSRLDTIRKKFVKYHEIYKNNKQYVDLAYYFFESLHIGYSYSNTLKKIYSKDPRHQDLLNISEIKILDEKERIQFIGIVNESYLRKSKAGNRYLQLHIKDETGELDVKLFGDKIDACQAENQGNLPTADNIVLVKGMKVQGNTIFANTISTQRHKIFLKLSDLKEDKEENT